MIELIVRRLLLSALAYKIYWSFFNTYCWRLGADVTDVSRDLIVRFVDYLLMMMVMVCDLIIQENVFILLYHYLWCLYTGKRAIELLSLENSSGDSLFAPHSAGPD